MISQLNMFHYSIVKQNNRIGGVSACSPPVRYDLGWGHCLRERGNLSPYYWNLSAQSIQRIEYIKFDGK